MKDNDSRPKFISGANIPVMRLQHGDERRDVREAELTAADGGKSRVTMLHIKGIGALGNHYHEKPEYFTVLSGNPTVLTAPKDNPDQVTVNTYPDGGHITMDPGVAHTFHFEGPGTLMSTMDGAFDPTDMHPLPLKRPDQQ